MISFILVLLESESILTLHKPLRDFPLGVSQLFLVFVLLGHSEKIKPVREGAFSLKKMYKYQAKGYRLATYGKSPLRTSTSRFFRVLFRFFYSMLPQCYLVGLGQFFPVQKRRAYV